MGHLPPARGGWNTQLGQFTEAIREAEVMGALGAPELRRAIPGLARHGTVS